MARQWTTQQQEAIETRNCGLIVSAAAGSGKTSVLIERLTQIICDREHPVPIEQMVVATFTNAAAAEMRQRLQLSLEEQISKRPHDTWLNRQQMMLPQAKISTINAFCFDFVREHAGDAGISAGFQILDDSMVNLLHSKAVDLTIRQWYEEHPAEMQQLWDGFCLKSDEPLETMLLALHDFFDSIPFHGQWMQKTLASYEGNWSATVYGREYLQSLRQTLRHLMAQTEYADNLALDLLDQSAKPHEWIEEDTTFLRQLLIQLEQPEISWEAIETLLDDRHQKRFRKSFPRKSKEITDEWLYDRTKEAWESYKDALKTCLEQLPLVLPYCQSDLDIHKKLMPLLLAMESDFSDALWQLKMEQNGISFADGERLTLELLSVCREDGSIDPSPLAEELSAYYQLIMIDEYQDSNNKQDYIFKLLSRNNRDPKTGELCYGDNIFLVGDVKQSIYRFRMANPHNFMQACEAAEQHQMGSRLRLIRLNQNFRSSVPVINFVNDMFSRIMSVRCGDVDYSEQEQLNAGADAYEALGMDYQKTEIHLIANEDEKEEDAVMCHTVQTIQYMLETGYPVVERDKTIRKCRPSDFCILMRTNSPCSAYVKALNEAGIPARGEEEKGYLQSREISLLIELLRVLDNPLLETSLTAVLLSPMFGFTADDMVQLRLIDRECSLYGVLHNLQQEETALGEKSRCFCETIEKLRMDSALYPLEELIRHIYEMTDFLSVMQLYQDGAKKKANLYRLLQYAKAYEENAAYSNFGGITGFLRYIDRMQEIKKDLKQVSSSFGADDVVSVMTMHKSKGLEFPFVFLCRLEKKFNTDDAKKKLNCTDACEAGLSLYDAEEMKKYKTLPYTSIEQKERISQKSEEMRLLYVALTRAKQQLFLPLKYDADRKKELKKLADQRQAQDKLTDGMIQKITCDADWVWMVLMERQDEALLQLVPELSGMTVQGRQSQDIQYRHIFVQESAPAPKKPPLPPPDADMQAELRQQMAFCYETPGMSQVSLMSVSGVSKSVSDGSELTLKRPRFLMTSGGRLTSTEHGTAVHTFFQYCNFENASQNAMQEVERLYETGFLTLEQKKSIRRYEVAPFFQQPLYQQIRKAKQVLREQKFLVRLGDLPFSEAAARSSLSHLIQYEGSDSMMKGIIDLAFEEADGNYVLVDYKTDAASREELIERYQTQLLIYKMALERITGKTVKRCLLYASHSNEVIDVGI